MPRTEDGAWSRECVPGHVRIVGFKSNFSFLPGNAIHSFSPCPVEPLIPEEGHRTAGAEMREADGSERSRNSPRFPGSVT